jgi:hypothetical protein
VREHYRESRRDLFVSTFSEEEFRRKVRAKRASLRASGASPLGTDETSSFGATELETRDE